MNDHSKHITCFSTYLIEAPSFCSGRVILEQCDTRQASRLPPEERAYVCLILRIPKVKRYSSRVDRPTGVQASGAELEADAYAMGLGVSKWQVYATRKIVRRFGIDRYDWAVRC